MKKMLSLFVLLILLSSVFVLADNGEDSCEGFFSSIWCFLFGDKEARAGMAWWDREETLVGMTYPQEEPFVIEFEDETVTARSEEEIAAEESTVEAPPEPESAFQLEFEEVPENEIKNLEELNKNVDEAKKELEDAENNVKSLKEQIKAAKDDLSKQEKVLSEDELDQREAAIDLLRTKLNGPLEVDSAQDILEEKKEALEDAEGKRQDEIEERREDAKEVIKEAEGVKADFYSEFPAVDMDKVGDEDEEQMEYYMQMRTRVASEEGRNYLEKANKHKKAMETYGKGSTEEMEAEGQKEKAFDEYKKAKEDIERRIEILEIEDEIEKYKKAEPVEPEEEEPAVSQEVDQDVKEAFDNDEIQCRTEDECNRMLATGKITFDEAYESLKFIADQEKLTDSERKKLAELKDQEELTAVERIVLKGLEDKEKKDKERQEKADNLKWQGTFWDGLTKMEGWYTDARAVTQNIGGFAKFAAATGSYRALSNLLMPETTKEWGNLMDTEAMNTWADWTGYVSRDICGYDEAMRADTPGQNHAFVHTRSGTYQFVGSIQAEVSSVATPILCEANPDREADEEWVCTSNLICKDDLYCYQDEDSEEPKKGYFHKISWGVTAPTDEKQTPYIDENGKAVKFNLKLDDEKWIYKRRGAAPKAVMELNNGGSDSGIIVKYLPKEYGKVCIIFHELYQVKDDTGNVVEKICTTFKESTAGVAKFIGSDRTAPSITTSSEEVELDI